MIYINLKNVAHTTSRGEKYVNSSNVSLEKLLCDFSVIYVDIAFITRLSLMTIVLTAYNVERAKN